MSPRLKRSDVALGALSLAFVVFIIVLVVSSLTRPELATFAPTVPASHEVGTGTVGPLLYTVDARSSEEWVYFDFSRGAAVETDMGSLDWDIAFRRHRMITNGGATNPRGRAGVIDLGPVAIESALTLPDTGYVVDERRGDEPRNPVLDAWYDYSWMSHTLQPADKAFALRTADGRYALIRFVSYYCPEAHSGCVTFRYRYRGDGKVDLPAVALVAR